MNLIVRVMRIVLQKQRGDYAALKWKLSDSAVENYSIPGDETGPQSRGQVSEWR
jgi:hypothetical protein